MPFKLLKNLQIYAAFLSFINCRFHFGQFELFLGGPQYVAAHFLLEIGITQGREIDSKRLASHLGAEFGFALDVLALVHY